MRAIRTLTLAVVFAALQAVAAATAVHAQSAVRIIDCRSLIGAGSFSNPLRIGTIDRTTVVAGCPGLSSGRGFNVRYFSFRLVRPAPNGAAIGTRFVPVRGAISAVHPRLATATGVTLLTSSRNGIWAQQPPATIRYFPIGGLRPGAYVFGAEKLDSPLRSLRTPAFDILFVVS